MYNERDWADISDRLEDIRAEAATHRLLKLHPAHPRPRTNVWARLLPALRRLEGWMERHDGTRPEPQLH